MCNISKSMRMSRPEYNLCAIKNTNNTENMMKNDLKIAWIYPNKTRKKKRKNVRNKWEKDVGKKREKKTDNEKKRRRQ